MTDHITNENGVGEFIKIYVAGKYADAPLIQTHIEFFESHGFTITHNWTKVEKAGTHSYEQLGEFSKKDVDGVVEADYLIIFITDQTYTYRGTCTELGVALGLGKKVFIVCDLDFAEYLDNIFAKHPLVHHFKSREELITAFAVDCSGCYMVAGNYQKCSDCTQQVCLTCLKGDSQSLNNWLQVSTRCSVCLAVVCLDCVNVCYDCANHATNYNTYCSGCCPKTMRSVKCKSHAWQTCGKHTGQCGACAAIRKEDKHIM